MSTQVQTQVGEALEVLGLEAEPAPPHLMGGPSRYPITDKVIQNLAEKKGQTLVINSDGSAKFESAPAPEPPPKSPK